MYMYRCISISFEFKDNCLYNDLIRHIERIYNIIVVCLFFSWRKQKEKKKERKRIKGCRATMSDYVLCRGFNEDSTAFDVLL